MEALGICIVLCMRVKQTYEYIILYVKDMLYREAGNAQTHARTHSSSFMEKFIDGRIQSALEKWAYGAKCGFPGSDSFSLWPLCLWPLTSPTIAKSTCSFGLKYLRCQHRKSVRDLKYGSLWTT